MKFSYKFSNLLGTVYTKGNLLFTGDGNTVISPVGNRLSLFDLKNDKSETLAIESRYNINRIALSPNKKILIAVNEDQEGMVVSLVSKTLLRRHRFVHEVHDIQFSPDGKYLAVVKGSSVVLYQAPGSYVRTLEAFTVVRFYKCFGDDVMCLNWSSDSRFLAAGCRDMSTLVLCVSRFTNMFHCWLSGHNDVVLGSYFEDNSLNLCTVSRSGQISVWECNRKYEDLEECTGHKFLNQKKKRKLKEVESEDDGIDDPLANVEEDMSEEKKDRGVYYKKISKYYSNVLGKLTATSYNSKTRMLVTAYSTGEFFLHEMPNYELIHSLSIEKLRITSVCFNPLGDWLALGCADMGQLVVWEWQSETYVLKQQGHFNNMSCLAFSPDGHHLATGGEDGKVKLWNMSSGFCFVTFTEHTSGVSALTYCHNGKAILTASLDGTVRAFDMARYRNFKTFTSPRPEQFVSLAVDPSGEIICAGGQDNFEIYVWSMKAGRLLEILSGHTSPVSSLTFSPSESILVSGSWDRTFKVWDVFSGKASRETTDLFSDVLCVSFRPDGAELAAATLNGYITFFHVESHTQTGVIEGRNDLGSGKREGDLVSAKQVLKGKAFTTICYSADGVCILAAGQSKNVCIYHVAHQILLKKFAITKNHSFDGMDSFTSRRKMSEFGNLALVEERDPDDPNKRDASIATPGVRKTDMASRSFKPEVNVTCIRFSPTGRTWSATTTEGLLVYSLDNNVTFDPLELETEITVSGVKNALRAGDLTKALFMALKLNETGLVAEVVEGIRPSSVKLVVDSLTFKYLERLLAFLANQLESSAHLEFYLLWTETLLMTHGQQLKDKSLHVLSLLHNLQRIIHQKQHSLAKICDHNKFSMQYFANLGQLTNMNNTEQSVKDESTEDFMEETII